ncbi:MAG TPA: shikimate kinase [Candidatus Limnocylindrales bacterium]|nr:shikimate kinase [Candidatus Limnocylindrales bacterium]
MSPASGGGGGPQRAGRIVLVGLMGSGKSTIGRRLARRLGWPMRDSDDQLRSLTGLTARAYGQAHGTPALHQAEAEALLAALAEPGPLVIGAAASVIENSAARAALRGPGVAVVWLRGSPAVLAARFGGGAHRPIYGPDPLAVAREQAQVREPLFASVDPITIDVDRHRPARIEEAALDGLRERLPELRLGSET